MRIGAESDDPDPYGVEQRAEDMPSCGVAPSGLIEVYHDKDQYDDICHASNKRKKIADVGNERKRAGEREQRPCSVLPAQFKKQPKIPEWYPCGTRGRQSSAPKQALQGERRDDVGGDNEQGKENHYHDGKDRNQAMPCREIRVHRGWDPFYLLRGAQ